MVILSNKRDGFIADMPVFNLILFAYKINPTAGSVVRTGVGLAGKVGAETPAAHRRSAVQLGGSARGSSLGLSMALATQ
jgi:hypothetical protein